MLNLSTSPSRTALGSARASASREGLISTVEGSLGSLARSQVNENEIFLISNYCH